jgi:DNA-directed RNA polymerase subunit M/transcription elongation factor TFIIS
MGSSKEKIEAIYDLRDAAEKKALAEKAVDENPTPQNRHHLLDRQLELEDKTMTAIERCHECGHPHARDRSHS